MKVNICGQVHFLSLLNMQICDLFVSGRSSFLGSLVKVKSPKIGVISKFRKDF